MESKRIEVNNKEAMEVIKRIAMGQILQEEKTIHLKEAIETLCNALKEDEGYYKSWSANISMNFYNESRRFKKEFGRKLLNNSSLKEIANTAADNFLKLLINK